MSTVTAIVDAHVHIHSCYEPDELLSHAYKNLAAAQNGGAAPALFLLMTECAADDYFGALYAAAHGVGTPTPLLRQWKMSPTEESSSVIAVSGARQLFIIGGRQVACREGLEVLLLHDDFVGRVVEAHRRVGLRVRQVHDRAPDGERIPVR